MRQRQAVNEFRPRFPFPRRGREIVTHSPRNRTQPPIRPNTLAVRNAITAEVTDLFRTDVDFETELVQSVIDEAISIADGEDAHEITAISSLTPGDWSILTLGTITFNTLA